ncbi:DUF2019 domain-containing protein [Actinopolymorpha sp. B17G11]|uniref:DUF2019 domain-containing protein n=1 Tax=unclassified Actinopolymorpha TaxID=2627063 RepID=UPI0032D95410
MSDPAARYLATLGKMAEAEGDDGLGQNRPRQWNRLVERLQVARKELAATESGQELINGLLDDPRVTVRLWAASHALHWNAHAARTVLEEIQADPALGLNGLNAEMTLREFDARRLNPDW